MFPFLYYIVPLKWLYPTIKFARLFNFERIGKGCLGLGRDLEDILPATDRQSGRVWQADRETDSSRVWCSHVWPHPTQDIPSWLYIYICAVVHIECDLPIESREPSATAKDVKHVDTKQMTGQNKHGNICLGGLQTASKWSGPWESP